jgi:hypothetical protein
MPHVEILWTEGPDGNIAHLAEHDVFPEEAEEVLREPSHTAWSRRSGRPIVFGVTRTGRRLAVVYEHIGSGMVLPITAYDVD